MATIKMNHNREVGIWGEQAAAEYIQKKGYEILEKNIRTPHGEIDIIARVEDVIVFVEVKTRTSRSFGLPEEGLTYRKLVHMLSCAKYYASIHEIDTWQCDAIAVEGFPGTTPHIEHFENVTAR
jgi:putative endonuclease